ncbi:MAG: Vitamin B12 import ATP-binding protein BtuD [Phycisphaerae bacterium]|nr:Vitamin B12 import ATP-binding protein BtuD [Phycisphaerae bacterium]
MNAVELERISKTFKSVKAVDDLSLSVPEGSIYGFIGPNGSGKTTTLRMIMRIYYPDLGSGAIRILGRDHSAAANDRIGYLPEERGLYRKMKVRDLLKFFLELHGHRRNLSEPIQSWLARLRLSDWADKKVETLSKGMSQRIQFIAAVVHSPKLLILDEPFSGLDPVSTEDLREAILDLRRGGATILFSTHDMHMAEKMCDYVLMIYQGRKVLDGTLESIQARYGADTLRVAVEGNGQGLTSLPGVERVADFGRLAELKMSDGADPQRVLEALIGRGRVTHFEVTRPTLHDIFVRIARPKE